MSGSVPLTALRVAHDCGCGHKWVVRGGVALAGKADARQIDVLRGEVWAGEDGPRPKVAFAVGGCDGWSVFHQGCENFVVVPVISPAERRAGRQSEISCVMRMTILPLDWLRYSPDS